MRKVEGISSRGTAELLFGSSSASPGTTRSCTYSSWLPSFLGDVSELFLSFAGRHDKSNRTIKVRVNA